MARDGSGDYSRVAGPYIGGTTILKDNINDEMDDVGEALSNSINIAGTKAWAADQSVGGFKLTNLGAPTNANDAARKSYVDAIPGTTAQPLDTTLTALAALAWSSGNALLQMTAADTVSLTLTPSVTDLTLSGVLKAAAGSASAPSLSFSADPNTGIYNNGSDTLLFTAGGTARLNLNTAALFASSGTVFNAGSGTVSAPGLSFISDTNNGFYLIGTDNYGASVGGAKVVDFLTTGIEITGTLRGRAPLSSETSGTLTAASANKRVKATGGVTINDGVFTAEDAVEIYNDSDSSITLTQDTGMTLRLAGSTSTGNRTLAARAIAYVYFDTNADAAVAGSGVS